MRDVHLHEIVLENFQSYTSEAVSFPAYQPGFYFLSGKNEVAPRLGANGAGKSTLFNAVVWCLYGTTAKGSKTSDVLSWGAKKVCVSTTWQISGQEYVITREGPPNRLYINETPVTQEELDAILGLSRIRFLHSIIFGQDCRLFIDLPVSDRAILLDEIMDLSVWQTLSDHARARTKALEGDIDRCALQLSRLQGTLDGLDTKALEALSVAWDRDYEKETERLIEELATLEERETLAQQALTIAEKTYKDASAKEANDPTSSKLTTIHEKIRKRQTDLGGAQQRLAQLEHEHSTLSANKPCPTCGQKMPGGLVVVKLDSVVIDKDKLKTLIGQINKQITAYDVERCELLAYNTERQTQLRTQHQALWEAQTKHKAALQTTEALAEEVRRRIDMGSTNPYTAQIEAIRAQRIVAQEAIAAKQAEKLTHEGTHLTTKFWIEGFKRVRLFLIQRILTTLELEVNNAASALGLPGWHIAFKTETETKSGSTRFGVRIEVSSGQATGAWEVWSGGEGQRIKLAVAIGLANLIQRMAGLRVLLEVWDEPTAWLSSEGIEDLVECLRYRSDMTGKQIWLVDQRAHEVSSFTDIWRVTKTAQGSKVAQLSKGSAHADGNSIS